MIDGYYFITDSPLSRAGNTSDVRAACAAKLKVIQYRNKTSSSRDFFLEASALRKICRKAIFLINDRIDIALAVDADGVHLGQEDLPYREARKMLGRRRIIGLTVHSIQEAVAAEKMGVDYLGVSPIFTTNTKADAGTPLGIEGLSKIRKKVALPIVALGGIDLENASAVIAAGADAIGAISAVVTKPDVQREIERFQRLFKL